MSEIGGSESRKTIKKRAARIAGSAIAGAAFALGADQGGQSVSAADHTPTPDALGTQIAGAKATLTAETTQTERERQLTELNKQLTVVVERRNATATPRPNTATPRPTPEPSATRIPPAVATANTEARRADALGKRQAEIIATATRDAELTATVETRASATSQAKQATAVAVSERNRERNQGVGFREVAESVVGIGLIGTLLYRGRNRIGRAINWVRGRFGGGTPPAGGATPPVPPATGPATPP